MPTVPKHDHAGRVPEPKHTPRFRVRDAFVAMGVTCALLVLFAGGAVKRWGEQMSPGVPRDVVLAVGRPTAWIASRLPFQHLGHELTASLSAQSDLSHAGGGFGTPLRAARAGVPPVTPDAFDPSAIGSKPRRPPPLKTVLVTGDSMAMPLDVDLA